MPRQALEQEEGLCVVGQAGTVQEALALPRKVSPNVLLLALVNGDGFDLIPTLRQDHPQLRVLLCTDAYSDEVVLRSLSAGAWGCVSKDEGPATVAKAIQAVSNGEVWAPRRLLSQVFFEAQAGGQRHNGRTWLLTGRERDICHLVTQGKTNKEVAAKLSISDKTVKSHLNHIFRKLQVRGRVELASLQVGQRERASSLSDP
ncbi:MAG: response regulator transcription factor [Gammaproteobacteria bacterium]|nr:response regulator transcription factor [Gammaproteobacteria bacterium]